MTEMIHLEAAERVVGAMLKIAAEDTARIVELEAEVARLQASGYDMVAAFPGYVKPWSQVLEERIHELLRLCDEQDSIADEMRVPREDGSIDVAKVREVLAP